MSQSELLQLVLEVAASVNPALGDRIPLDRGPDAPLFGPDAALDSLGLITFVATIEEVIAESLGVNVVLIDERVAALDESPYRTIRTLVDYIETLMRDHPPTSES